MYYKLLTKKIRKKYNKATITNDILEDTLKNIAVNNPFSTFPYILSNANSKKSIKYFNSGNCIALCMAGKNLLKSKYNINSFIIPSTIPKIFQKEGYLDICHVALYIPQNKDKAYILDFAFYLKTPIIINLNDFNTIYPCRMMNIYNKIEENLSYKLHILNEKKVFNNYQKLPKNTKYINIYYNNNPSDSWNYFIREIINPDKGITTFFINIRKYPFLCLLDNNYNIKLYIKFLDNQNFIIKEYQNIIFNGSLFELPIEILEKIKPIVAKYFNYNVLMFLNSFNPYKKFIFKDSKKTKKNKKIKKYKKNKKKIIKTLKRLF